MPTRRRRRRSRQSTSRCRHGATATNAGRESGQSRYTAAAACARILRHRDTGGHKAGTKVMKVTKVRKGAEEHLYVSEVYDYTDTVGVKAAELAELKYGDPPVVEMARLEMAALGYDPKARHLFSY